MSSNAFHLLADVGSSVNSSCGSEFWSSAFANFVGGLAVTVLFFAIAEIRDKRKTRDRDKSARLAIRVSMGQIRTLASQTEHSWYSAASMSVPLATVSVLTRLYSIPSTAIGFDGYFSRLESSVTKVQSIAQGLIIETSGVAAAMHSANQRRDELLPELRTAIAAVMDDVAHFEGLIAST